MAHRQSSQGHKKTPRRLLQFTVQNPEQGEQIRQHAKGPVVDLLWSTGCRPQEAHILEAKQIHGDVIIFAIDESKG